MADYNLPNITTELGTFKILLKSTITSLTVPTYTTILDLGSVSQKLDFTPGVNDPEMLRFKVVDDYTVHANGFWYEALQGDAEIRLYVEIGGTDYFLFWGDVRGTDTSYSDFYVSGTTARRTIDLTCVSRFKRLEDVTIANLVTEMLLHDVEGANGLYPGMYIKLTDIFASAMKLLSGSTFDTTDAYIWMANGADFSFINGSTENPSCSLDDLYVQLQTGAYGGPYTTNRFFNSGSSEYVGNIYANAYEFLKALAASLCLSPRYFYNITGTRERIYLTQRGRARSGYISPGTLLSSSFKVNALKLNSAHVHRYTDATHGYHAYKIDWEAGGAPSYLHPVDVTIPVHFVIEAAGTDPEGLYYVDLADSNAVWPITGITVYKYDEDTTVSITTDSYRYQHGLVQYLMHRYPSEGQRTYQREYYGINTDLVLASEVQLEDTEVYTVVDIETMYGENRNKVTLQKLI
jgi:hypothetical protein